jgi:hypothetical protein
MSDKKFKSGSKSSDEIYNLLDDLQKVTEYNLEFYRHDKSSNGIRLLNAFNEIKDNLNSTRPIIKQFEDFCSEYDYDEKIIGNGYRSWIFIYTAAVKYTKKISKYIHENKQNLLFRKQIYVK